MAATHSPTFRSVGTSHGHSGQIAVGFNLDQGDVRYRIPADDFGIVFGIIFEDNLDRVCAFHHMVVGDNIAVFINDEAGALSWLLEFRLTLLSEIPAKEIFKLFVAAKRVFVEVIEKPAHRS